MAASGLRCQLWAWLRAWLRTYCAHGWHYRRDQGGVPFSRTHTEIGKLVRLKPHTSSGLGRRAVPIQVLPALSRHRCLFPAEPQEDAHGGLRSTAGSHFHVASKGSQGTSPREPSHGLRREVSVLRPLRRREPVCEPQTPRLKEDPFHLNSTESESCAPCPSRSGTSEAPTPFLVAEHRGWSCHHHMSWGHRAVQTQGPRVSVTNRGTWYVPAQPLLRACRQPALDPGAAWACRPS